MNGWKSLFDGRSLEGWLVTPRTYGTVAPDGRTVLKQLPRLPRGCNRRAAEHPAVWSVESGAIVSHQAPDASGWGGYLVSEEAFSSSRSSSG